MGYQEALEAAGATVRAFQEFGSYQGDWWAFVALPDGKHGWINGSYGSCSVCDAFQSEFDDDEKCESHQLVWDPPVDCPDCVKAREGRAVRLADFGRSYLDGLMSQADAEAKAAKDLKWDSGAQEMLDYIKANADPASLEDQPR
jgi:hypothetical protein